MFVLWAWKRSWRVGIPLSLLKSGCWTPLARMRSHPVCCREGLSEPQLEPCQAIRPDQFVLIFSIPTEKKCSDWREKGLMFYVTGRKSPSTLISLLRAKQESQVHGCQEMATASGILIRNAIQYLAHFAIIARGRVHSVADWLDMNEPSLRICQPNNADTWHQIVLCGTIVPYHLGFCKQFYFMQERSHSCYATQALLELQCSPSDFLLGTPSCTLYWCWLLIALFYVPTKPWLKHH